jgi:threonine aldolase
VKIGGDIAVSSSAARQLLEQHLASCFLLAERFRFYHDRWAPGVARFVASCATTQGDVDDLLAVAKSLAS